MFMQESLYIELLVEVERFAISGSHLTIEAGDGQTIRFALKQ